MRSDGKKLTEKMTEGDQERQRTMTDTIAPGTEGRIQETIEVGSVMILVQVQT